LLTFNEDEIHNGGIIDVDLYSQPMQLLLVGGGADFGGRTDFGGSTDFGRSTDLRRTADLRAQHQGKRIGGRCSEDGE
jgi:hypothetical protein